LEAFRFSVSPGEGVRKSKTGRELDGKKYDGLPGRVELPVLENTRRMAAITEIERLYLPSNPTSDATLFSEQEAAGR
jgi:hypothetical protein